MSYLLAWRNGVSLIIAAVCFSVYGVFYFLPLFAGLLSLSFFLLLRVVDQKNAYHLDVKEKKQIERCDKIFKIFLGLFIISLAMPNMIAIADDYLTRYSFALVIANILLAILSFIILPNLTSELKG